MRTKTKSCADLRTRSAIILHSPESGIVGPTETTQQATSDDQLLALWLHGRPDTTQRAYRAETIRFMGYVEKPIRSVKLIDLQVFADHLGEAGLKPPSVHRAMSAIKSLFAFGFRLGYTQFDVGRALRIPSFRNELAERILGEAEVLRIISLSRILETGRYSLPCTLAVSVFRKSARSNGGTFKSGIHRARLPSSARAARPELSSCPRAYGKHCRLCSRMHQPMLRFSRVGRRATWTNPRCGGS